MNGLLSDMNGLPVPAWYETGEARGVSHEEGISALNWYPKEP